jgi:branched-chain amino acid transport system substrate-binding protein
MASIPSYRSEAHVYAKHLLANHPDGKIGILYQNDDYGKNCLKGFRDGIAGKIRIVDELPYEPTEPTVYSQIASLQASGADVFFDASSASAQRSVALARAGTVLAASLRSHRFEFR